MAPLLGTGVGESRGVTVRRLSSEAFRELSQPMRLARLRDPSSDTGNYL